MSSPHQARLKLLLIAAMFFAPVVAAVTVFFYFPEWIPGRVNYGTLISPARAAPPLGLVDVEGAPAPLVLQGKWSLVYLGGTRCEDDCRARLVLTRQVRAALNQNRTRVQRVYVGPTRAALAAARALLAPEHPDLVFVAQTGAGAAEFFQPTDAQAVYLLDPLGNWLMVYTGVIEARGLHRDLKKLLRVSQVG